MSTEPEPLTPITNDNIRDAIDMWCDPNTKQTAETIYGHISQWDTSNVTIMNNLFNDKYDFNDDISQWDTSNVTTMINMFRDARAFNQDISKWNTTNVNHMGSMFYGAHNFNQDLLTQQVTTGPNSPYIAWDVSNVTNIDQMFCNCTNFNGNIENWQLSTNLTSLFYVFEGCQMFNKNLSTKLISYQGNTYTAWDISRIQSLRATFRGCINFDGNINNWNTSSVTNLIDTFRDCYNFNQNISTKKITLGINTYTAWQTTNVTDMRNMFENAKKFNQPIRNWTVSSSILLNNMFDGASEMITQYSEITGFDITPTYDFFNQESDETQLFWEQLNGDIDGESNNHYSGWSLSFSKYGTRLAIGTTEHDGYNGVSTGYVKIYDFNEDEITWNQLGNKIIGDRIGDFAGWSVSLSEDGTKLAIGAPQRNLDNSSYGNGYVSVYQYNHNENRWDKLGSNINGTHQGDGTGRSVSLNEDGTRVAVGAPYHSAGPNDAGTWTGYGVVRVYNYNGSSWQLIGSIYGKAYNEFSGWSVSLNNDGTRVAIGAPKNDGIDIDSGVVRLYQYNSGTTWEQLGSSIVGVKKYSNCGNSVSFNNDGTRVAIGSTVDNGSVRVYEYDGTTWNQLGNTMVGEVYFDFSGHSVSLSKDGTTVAIGAFGNDESAHNSGHVRVYRYDGTSWNLLAHDIDGEDSNDYSGHSVSISTTVSNKTRVAISAPWNNGEGIDTDNRGHVRVYELKEPEPEPEPEPVSVIGPRDLSYEAELKEEADRLLDRNAVPDEPWLNDLKALAEVLAMYIEDTKDDLTATPLPACLVACNELISLHTPAA